MLFSLFFLVVSDRGPFHLTTHLNTKIGFYKKITGNFACNICVWASSNEHTVGRDKILRTLQYFSRFYAWYLYRTNRPQSSIDPYNAVKKQFGTTRKILRIGKFAEHLKAAAVAADNKSPVDPVLRYLAVGRQLGYAGYLTLDTITVIDVIGFRKLAAAKRLQDTAYRSWLAGLICSAIASVYSLWRLREKERTLDRTEGEGVVEAKKLEKFVHLQYFGMLYSVTNPVFPGNAPLPASSSSRTFVT